jgi:hypothetical protein
MKCMYRWQKANEFYILFFYKYLLRIDAIENSYSIQNVLCCYCMPMTNINGDISALKWIKEQPFASSCCKTIRKKRIESNKRIEKYPYYIVTIHLIVLSLSN